MCALACFSLARRDRGSEERRSKDDHVTYVAGLIISHCDGIANFADRKSCALRIPVRRRHWRTCCPQRSRRENRKKGVVALPNDQNGSSVTKLLCRLTDAFLPQLPALLVW